MTTTTTKLPCGCEHSHTKRAIIAAILDESGSMDATRKDTIGGFNKFLREQQERPEPARMLVTMFNTASRIATELTDLKFVQPLSESTYAPTGGTALLDAVYDTVTRLQLSVQHDEIPIILVMTDGEENSSHRTTVEAVRELVLGCRAKGWQFVFIGASPEAWGQAGALGFSKQSTGGYVPTRGGLQTMYASSAANVSSMRASGMSVGADTMNWTTGEAPEDATVGATPPSSNS